MAPSTVRALHNTCALFCVLYLVGCTTPDRIEPDDLKPFTTDGCSRFLDGSFDNRKLWCHCCAKHDQAYWQGGTREQRQAADLELRECVKAVDKPKTAALMQIGVRAGGSPLWPTSFRWGYGWPYYRGYKPLSETEQRKAESLLGSYELAAEEVCYTGDDE